MGRLPRRLTDHGLPDLPPGFVRHLQANNKTTFTELEGIKDLGKELRKHRTAKKEA